MVHTAMGKMWQGIKFTSSNNAHCTHTVTYIHTDSKNDNLIVWMWPRVFYSLGALVRKIDTHTLTLIYNYIWKKLSTQHTYFHRLQNFVFLLQLELIALLLNCSQCINWMLVFILNSYGFSWSLFESEAQHNRMMLCEYLHRMRFISAHVLVGNSVVLIILFNLPFDCRDFLLCILNVHFCQLNRWCSTELLNRNMVLCQVLEILAKNLLKIASSFHYSILKMNRRKKQTHFSLKLLEHWFLDLVFKRNFCSCRFSTKQKKMETVYGRFHMDVICNFFVNEKWSEYKPDSPAEKIF